MTDLVLKFSGFNEDLNLIASSLTEDFYGQSKF